MGDADRDSTGETVGVVLDELGRVGTMVDQRLILGRAIEPDFLEVEPVDRRSLVADFHQPGRARSDRARPVSAVPDVVIWGDAAKLGAPSESGAPRRAAPASPSRLRRAGVRVPIAPAARWRPGSSEACGEVSDKVRGLELGANESVTQRFAFEEFVARVRAALRPPGQPTADSLEVGDLPLDLLTKVGWRAGRRIDLAPQERALLELFMRSPAHVLGRSIVLSRVLDFSFEPGTNVIDVDVGSLRRTLNRPSLPRPCPEPAPTVRRACPGGAPAGLFERALRSRRQGFLPYSSSDTCSPHSISRPDRGASQIARCVMKWFFVAPCQCQTPGPL